MVYAAPANNQEISKPHIIRHPFINVLVHIYDPPCIIYATIVHLTNWAFMQAYPTITITRLFKNGS